MKCLKSFHRFSTKIVKMDINSILAGDVSKTPKENMNNMLLFYYPISKKHFEENSDSLNDCIETNCDGKEYCQSSPSELIDVQCDQLITNERKKIMNNSNNMFQYFGSNKTKIKKKKNLFKK